MTTSSDATDLIFKTCGVHISLSDDQPESVKIFHSVPKGYPDLAKQRTNGMNCDITIAVGVEKMYGHKAILSSRIPFFRALFDSDMAECSEKEINLFSKINEFDAVTINSLLNYAYTGRLTISVNHFQYLVMGAAYFGLEYVIDECTRFMRKRMNVDNAFPLLFFCKSLALKSTEACILKFIDKNFVSISLTTEFLELSIEDLETFLQRDTLYIDNENQVFEAVIRWIGDDSDKKQYAAKLLKCVRWTHLTESIIVNTIEKTEWVMSDFDCAELVNESKDYLKNKTNGDKLKSIKTVERVCDDSHRLLYGFGKVPFEDKLTMHLYDPISNAWKMSRPEVSTIRRSHRN